MRNQILKLASKNPDFRNNLIAVLTKKISFKKTETLTLKISITLDKLVTITSSDGRKVKMRVDSQGIPFGLVGKKEDILFQPVKLQIKELAERVDKARK